MESLQVRTGEISLQILDDDGNERGVFRFNPEDVHSANRILALQEEFDIKQADFEKRARKCETQQEQAALLEEVVDYFENLIDDCFGEGTSKIVFGNSKSLSMFEDFFQGITPYYQKASQKRMSKYTKNGK